MSDIIFNMTYIIYLGWYTRIWGPPGCKSKLQFHTGADTPDHWMKPAAAAHNKTVCVCVYRLHKRANNAHRGLTYLYNMCSVGFKRFRWVVPSPVAMYTRTRYVYYHNTHARYTRPNLIRSRSGGAQ